MARMRKLDLPAVLVVTALGAGGTAALVSSCGGDDDPPACEVYCVPIGGGPSPNCEAPDLPCATGPNLDQCPAGCEPEPVA